MVPIVPVTTCPADPGLYTSYIPYVPGRSRLIYHLYTNRNYWHKAGRSLAVPHVEGVERTGGSGDTGGTTQLRLRSRRRWHRPPPCARSGASRDTILVAKPGSVCVPASRAPPFSLEPFGLPRPSACGSYTVASFANSYPSAAGRPPGMKMAILAARRRAGIVTLTTLRSAADERRRVCPGSLTATQQRDPWPRARWRSGSAAAGGIQGPGGGGGGGGSDR